MPVLGSELEGLREIGDRRIRCPKSSSAEAAKYEGPLICRVEPDRGQQVRGGLLTMAQAKMTWPRRSRTCGSSGRSSDQPIEMPEGRLPLAGHSKATAPPIVPSAWDSGLQLTVGCSPRK